MALTMRFTQDEALLSYVLLIDDETNSIEGKWCIDDPQWIHTLINSLGSMTLNFDGFTGPENVIYLTNDSVGIKITPSDVTVVLGGYPEAP